MASAQIATIVVSLLVAAGVVAYCYCRDASIKWRPGDVPRPWDDPRRCGLPSASWICDPDGLMQQSDYPTLQKALEKLYNSKNVVQCPDGSKKGILLSVVAVDNVDMDGACKTRWNWNYDWRAKCMEEFTRAVAESWNAAVTECHNGAVLGISRGLSAAYIATAAGTRKVLSDEVLTSIVNVMVPHVKKKNYASSVLAGVNGIERHIRGRSHVRIALILFAVFCFVGFLFFLVADSGRGKLDEDSTDGVPILETEGKELTPSLNHLSDRPEEPTTEVDPEQEYKLYYFGNSANLSQDLSQTAPSNQANQSGPLKFVCPLCCERPENVPTKALSCKHQFHTDCIDQWLMSNQQCPNCCYNLA